MKIKKAEQQKIGQRQEQIGASQTKIDVPQGTVFDPIIFFYTFTVPIYRVVLK